MRNQLCCIIVIAVLSFLLLNISEVKGQVAVPIPPDKEIFGSENPIQELFQIGGLLWIETLRGKVYQIEGETAEQIVGLPEGLLSINSIVDIGGKPWVVAEEAVYRVEGNRAIRIQGEYTDFRVRKIKLVAGKIWILAVRGLYIVDGQTIQSIQGISNAPMNVMDVEDMDGKVWIMTQNGVFLSEGKVARRIISSDEQPFFWRIKKINTDIWVWNEQHLYRVNGETSHRIVDIPRISNVPISSISFESMYIQDIREIDGRVWVLTLSGAYRMEGEKAQRIPNSNLGDIYAIQEISGTILLVTTTGTYRIVDEGYQQILGIPGNLLLRSNRTPIIKEIGGQTWIISGVGAFLVEGNRARRVPDQEDIDVHDIKETSGKVWVTTNKGAYKVEEKEIHAIPDEETDVFDIIETAGKVWLATNKGAYRIEGEVARRIPDDTFSVQDIREISGHPWFIASKPTTLGVLRDRYTSLYRVDEDMVISILLGSRESVWKSLVQLFLGRNVWIGGIKPDIRYKLTNAKNPLSGLHSQKFEVIIETNKDKFSEAVRGKRYNPAESYEQSLPIGNQTLYISVRDIWANTFNYQFSGLVLPELQVFAVAFPILIWLMFAFFLLIVFLLAPYFDICHDLLMNPWLRNVGSIGLIPAITIFPFFRRHLLWRYIRKVREDNNFAEWKKRFVVPTEDFFPERFGQVLEKHRAVFLTGQSGIGKTSYFKYLTYYYAENFQYFTNYVFRQIKIGSFSKKIIPVFVSLQRYIGTDPNDMFHSQLSSFGRLTDDKLTSWLLKKGGFVVFFDGLNEVDKETTQKVNRFLDENRKENYFCISSQESPSDFAWVKETKLSSLNPDKIREFLQLQLGEQQAKSVIDQFSKEMYEIYGIPQDLEFGLEVVKQKQPLPRSKKDLYKIILTPILKIWEQAKRIEYPDLLFRRAYEMVCKKESVFNKKDSVFPDEFMTELINKKILIRHRDDCLIRHDLIKGYLAASYFFPRWQELLQTDAGFIDSNWLPMLEFTILEIGQSKIIEKLLLTLHKHEKKIAWEVFSLLTRNYSNLCLEWKQDFILRHGEALLDLQA